MQPRALDDNGFWQIYSIHETYLAELKKFGVDASRLEPYYGGGISDTSADAIGKLLENLKALDSNEKKTALLDVLSSYKNDLGGGLSACCFFTHAQSNRVYQALEDTIESLASSKNTRFDDGAMPHAQLKIWTTIDV
jgi:hypothetical protein